MRIIASLAPVQGKGRDIYVAYGKYYQLVKGRVTPFTNGLDETKYVLEGKLKIINPIEAYQETSYTDSMEDQIVELIITKRMQKVGRDEPNAEDLAWIRKELKKAGR